LMQAFYYLKYALGAILGFVGVKMLIADFVKIPSSVALAVVAGLFLIAIIASLILPKRKSDEEEQAL